MFSFSYKRLHTRPLSEMRYIHSGSSDNARHDANCTIFNNAYQKRPSHPS